VLAGLYKRVILEMWRKLVTERCDGGMSG
jgi:hypothetical protein